MIEAVMTVPEWRGVGIARTLAGLAVEKAFAARCRVAYLGNAPVKRSVYEKIGFKRVSGVFMRRAASGHEDYEAEAFAAGQVTRIRETNWGDLLGMACLVAQPMKVTLIDYGQGLTSTRCVPATRCVSAFTCTKYETESAGGIMFSLVGASPHRLLRFARAVPGPGGLRGPTARLDAATCDAFTVAEHDLVGCLLDWVNARKFACAEAFIAEADTIKREWFERHGFACSAAIPRALHYGDRWDDVLVLQKRL